MKNKFLLMILSCSLFFLTGHSMAETDIEKNWFYNVQKNDTLSDICKDNVSLRLSSCIQKLKHYNQLSNVNLSPEMVLKIPVVWLKEVRASVKIISSFGEVFYKNSNKTEWEKLGETVVLYAQDKLKTKNGNLHVMFDDGSVVSIHPNTELTLSVLEIGGHSTGKVKLFLSKGSIENKIIKRAQDVFEIDTPVGVAAVRGTNFRVRLVENDTVLFNETLSGEVMVKQGKATDSVKKNFGIKALKNVGLSDQKLLLDPPKFTMNMDSFGRYKINRVSWKSVKGAKKYQYELYQGKSLLLKKQVEGLQVGLSFMLPGKYSLFVRAIDEEGFEGKDAHVKLNFSS